MAAPATAASVQPTEKVLAESIESKLLKGIHYARGKLELLDQRKVPHEHIYIDIPDAEAAWHAIQDMVVRGAPAIAIAAALALAVEVVNREQFSSVAEARDHIRERLDYLVSSRPTAVNLGIAAEQLKKVVDEAAKKEKKPDGVTLAYIHAAEAMLRDDVAANRAIGAFGAQAIVEAVSAKKDKETSLRVLTHCNTGSLATAAYGTALGVIRRLYAEGLLEGAVCTETRPYNQGSRLTAFELVHDGIPATLIADSAAASLKALEKVDAVVVGADRIAANGDTANKIGTYALALSAYHHGIPFFVAAPTTSIDVTIESGDKIIIEQRSPKELTHALGGHGPQVAPDGISVWNPAFDVTPAALITGIITDKGVIKKPEGHGEFDILSFLDAAATDPASQPDANGIAKKKTLKERLATFFPLPKKASSLSSKQQQASSKPPPGIPSPDELEARGFKPLGESNAADYLASQAELAERLGGSKSEWKVKEVGDGNLNYVYIVEGPSGSLVLKQALPYIRCVGESWPMTLDRAFFEASVLREHGRLAPGHTPEVYHFDEPMALIAMEYLPPPHIILRKGLIAAVKYPLLADHVSTYMANTLFHTSLFALSTTDHKAYVAKYSSNVEMCRLTEQVIFTEPYQIAKNNHWTSPQLDDEVRAIREDGELKVAIASLKAKFCERTQALIHGDLHTGSIMVTDKSTYVIDPEFGFYGPMAFDIGAFLGNLFLAYFSQKGQAVQDEEQGDREEYKQWILHTIVDTWELFCQKFRQHWDDTAQSPGDAYPKDVYNSAQVRKASQDAFFREFYEDMLGFAAAKMIRRIVGIAHVEDLESIKNPDMRAECERGALSFAKRALKGRRTDYPTIEAIVADLRSWGHDRVFCP